MTEFAKALRWTAPGSVALLALLSVVVFSRACLQIFTAEDLPSNGLLNIDAAGLLTGAALSVPLGFIIYQMYFFYFSRPFLIWRAVRRDIGTEVLQTVESDLVNGPWFPRNSREPLLRFSARPRLRRLRGHVGPLWLYEREGQDWLPLPSNRQDVELQYYRQVERRWTLLQSRIDCCRFDGAEKMRGQLDRHADIYHTLGASRYALLLGWIAGVAWAGWSGFAGDIETRSWPKVFLILLAASAVALIGIAILAVMFHANRRHCNVRRQQILKLMLELDAKYAGREE